MRIKHWCLFMIVVFLGGLSGYAQTGIVCATGSNCQTFSPTGLTALTTNNGISYFGGPVLRDPQDVYFIWYGNWTNNTATTILPKLIQDLRGSSYYNIVSSYTDGNNNPIQNDLFFSGQTFDNYSQGSVLDDSQVLAIVNNALNSGALPFDNNGVYFVLLSADVFQSGALGTMCQEVCGWHNHELVISSDIKYSLILDPSQQCPNRISNACSAQSVTPNGNEGADAMANIIAHELMEAVTDPDLNAWLDSLGQEVADKCLTNFGATSQLSNGAFANVALGGSNYLLQSMWVNADGGKCDLSFLPQVPPPPPPQFALSVTITGTGIGSVVSNPAEIALRGGSISTATGSFAQNTIVTLTETPDPSVWFAGWSGACTGTGACSILMNQAKSVTATFIGRQSLTSGYDQVANVDEVEFNGSDQHVHQLWYNGAWHANDLTNTIGAPLAVFGSGFSSGYDNVAAVNLYEDYYVGADAHIHQLWYTSGQWHVTDVTLTAGVLADLALSSGVTSGFNRIANAQQVEYVTTNQHVQMLSYTGAWAGVDLTNATGAGLADRSTVIVSGYNPIANTQEVIFVGTNQHVYHIWYNGSWHSEDLSVTTAAPPASPTALTLTYNPLANVEEIEYVGSNQHVYELWYNGAWHLNDLTAVTGAPVASTLSAIVSAHNSLANVNEVEYVGSNQHIYQLWYNGAWHYNDLTGLTGAPSPTAASGLTLDFSVIGNVQELMYIGSNQHVYQLWYNGAWHLTDLTAAAQ